MAATHSVEDALATQAATSPTVGSPLCGVLLTGLLDDYRRGGITADILDGVTDRPVHDALALRYLAAGHLLALTGGAPALAAQYPSCGGQWAGDDAVVGDFLATVAAHRAEFVAGARRNVQTNEVGRAAVLASGFALITARHRLPLDQLEFGSSAGLLSRWDSYSYDTGATRCGTPGSAVVFGPQWWADGAPDLSAHPTVQRRRASDISPIDTSTEQGRARMLSFVWPDQLARVERLRAALAIAAAVPLQIESADAGEWLGHELDSGPTVGVATVVFHSVVWQYLPKSTQQAVRSSLVAAGDRAGDDSPVCWLRMEPATPSFADLRLTTWPGGISETLAEVGYHGAAIRWLA